jgi:hypothetical protein
MYFRVVAAQCNDIVFDSAECSSIILAAINGVARFNVNLISFKSVIIFRASQWAAYPRRRNFQAVGSDVFQGGIEKISHLTTDTGTIINRHSTAFINIDPQNAALWFTPEFDENQFQALIAAKGIRNGPCLSNDLRLLLLRRLLLFCLVAFHYSLPPLKKQKTGNRPFPKPGTPLKMA